MSTRKIIWCGCLVLALVIAAKTVPWHLRNRNQSSTAPEPPLATQPLMDARVIDRWGPQQAGAGPALAAQPVATQPVGERSEREEQEEDWGNLFPTAHALFEKDRFLARFGYYYKHVLLNHEGRLQYEKLLADIRIHRQVRQELLFPNEQQETTEGTLRRHIELRYLREALSWPENPQRQPLLTMITDMIVEDNFLSDQSPGLRMSLAGDKIELFEILTEQNPAGAQALAARARGGRLEGLLVYIADYVAHHRGEQPAQVVQLDPGN